MQSVLQLLTAPRVACLTTEWAERHTSNRFQQPNESYVELVLQGTLSLAMPLHTYSSIRCRG